MRDRDTFVANSRAALSSPSPRRDARRVRRDSLGFVTKAKSPFADPTRPTSAELRRWQAGYRRVAERQRALVAAAGFDRRRAVDLSLDILDAGLTTGVRPARLDAVRAREVDAVRATWRRLRAKVMKAR